MLYKFAYTIPKNTPPENPIKAKLKVTKGVLTRLHFEGHAGAKHVAGIKVFYQTHQIAPENADQWVTWDFMPIYADYFLKLDQEPYELEFWLYNSSTQYSHEIIVYITILPWQAILPSIILARLITGLEKFLRLVGLVPGDEQRSA